MTILSQRRFQRAGIALVVLAIATAAFGAAAFKNPSITAAGRGVAGADGESGELTPALAKKFAVVEAAIPGSYKEGDRAMADQDWVEHATPGNTIPSAAIVQSRADWERLRTRGGNSRNWKPLGPTHGKGLPNPFRDRSVYNAGTSDFSGRIGHVAIDPDCGRHGGGGGDHNDDDDCRLWIGNANGGVWRTDDALSSHPDWEFVSPEFEHNSVASLELDPNDSHAKTIWAGTGEPNACGSGCEASVGIYKSRNGGNSWTGPFGQDSFYNRAVGSIEVKPGNSNVIFAASGRAIRGLSSACCGGADALIPGAPHFGLWRSTNGGTSWQLVNQGADALCTAFTPDQVSLNLTPCSARGARRVVIDPVDPNTVYVSFFQRGIWRSRSNGNPGTWERIMAPLGNPALATTERAEFDVVRLPNGESRMYVGVGGGVVANPAPPPPNISLFARFRRNENVRSAPAPTVLGSWIDLTSNIQDTPGYSSFGYCDPQCAYDQYVYAPAAHSSNSGANADTVYLSGDNEYSENNWGPNSVHCCPDNPATGRSNGRGVLLSTNAGVHFTDMTEDDSDDVYPNALHPDHHALVVNPRNYKQFFSVGDGGIVRSNGRFVNDSGDCGDTQVKGYTGTRRTFCELVLSRVPERLKTLNKDLRTLHFYELNYDPNDPDNIIGGTQDNGSWERGDIQGSGSNGPNLPPGSTGTPDTCPSAHHESDSTKVWVNTNIADGGHNNFDIGDRCFRQSSFQAGQMMVAYEPRNQVDMNWIADTQFVFYGGELNAFVGVANDDRVHPHWLWSSREHVFRSTNQGRNPILTKETHREHCNIWYGDLDVDNNGIYEPLLDICDDWKPLGDPGPNGRLTSATLGDRAGGYTAAVERGHDSGTVWAATQAGRVFVSKNADAANPATVVFDRIDDDPTAANDPPRFPTAIYVDPSDSNHAWIAYSGFNAKTLPTPGHVFEVRYIPGASTFTLLDGDQPSDLLGDIPATSIAVTNGGTIYVGTDYGVIASQGDGEWRQAGRGLPNMPAPDLVYVPQRDKLYAATHAQGIWQLKLHGDDDDD